MKQILTPALIVAAFLGLGIAMPSCPGQQELEQKVDALDTSNKELSKKVQTLSTQLSTLSNDMGQVKTLLPQITNVISGQKGAMDKLEADIKALQVKLKIKKK